MPTLYHAPFSRSFRILWFLEEAGIPYTLKKINFMAGENRKPAYLSVNPTGKLPAIEDDGRVMCESGAILQYLIETYGKHDFEVPQGSAERTTYLQWLYWPETAMAPLATMAQHLAILPEEQRDPKAVEAARQGWRQFARVADEAVDGREFLAGDRFTAADVMFGYNLMLAKLFQEPFEGLERLKAYHARLESRPAFEKAAAP